MAQMAKRKEEAAKRRGAVSSYRRRRSSDGGGGGEARGGRRRHTFWGLRRPAVAVTDGQGLRINMGQGMDESGDDEGEDD